MRQTRGIKKIAAVLTVALALTAGLSACGESESGVKVYKVGVTQFADHPSLDNCREGFVRGLENGGYTVGVNVEIETKSAQGDMAMATQIAQSFVNGGMDLLCGIATPSAQSLYAMAMEKNIPVIFNAVSDPISAKLAVSATENMKGITGVSDELPVEAQLQLIREMLPEAMKIGILYTTSETNSISTLETYRALAPEYGFEIVAKGIGKQAEILQALDVLIASGIDCVSNMTDNTVVSALGVILDRTAQNSIPVFGSEEEQVVNGCIASAGLDYVKLGIQAGEMAAKVLDGQDISAINFEKLKESKIAVNAAVAESLGVTVSDELEAKAELVIKQ